MASFRGLVLVFVTDYLNDFGLSPSQGEIVNGVAGATRQRVRMALKSLAKDGLLIKVPGHRGLRLPTAREAARRVLIEEGYTIDEAKRLVAPPVKANTTPSLPGVPPLIYPKRTKGG